MLRNKVLASTASAFGVVWSPTTQMPLYFVTGVRLTAEQTQKFFDIAQQRLIAHEEERSGVDQLLRSYGVDLRSHSSTDPSEKAHCDPEEVDEFREMRNKNPFSGLRAQLSAQRTLTELGFETGRKHVLPSSRHVHMAATAAVCNRQRGKAGSRTFVLSKVFHLLDIGKSGVLQRRDWKPLRSLLNQEIQRALADTVGSPVDPPRNVPYSSNGTRSPSLLSAALREKRKWARDEQLGATNRDSRRSIVAADTFGFYECKTDAEYLCLCEFACTVVLPIIMQSSFLEVDFPSMAMMVFGAMDQHRRDSGCPNGADLWSASVGKVDKKSPHIDTNGKASTGGRSQCTPSSTWSALVQQYFVALG